MHKSCWVPSCGLWMMMMMIHAPHLVFDNRAERSPGVGVCSPDPEAQMRAEIIHMSGRALLHFPCSFWHFLTIFNKCKLLWEHHLSGKIHFLFCKESFQRGPLGMKYTWRTTNKIVWVYSTLSCEGRALASGWDLITMFYSLQSPAMSFSSCWLKNRLLSLFLWFLQHFKVQTRDLFIKTFCFLHHVHWTESLLPS